MVGESYLLPGRSDITCDNRTNVSDIPVLENLNWNNVVKTSTDVASKFNEISSK